MPIPAPEPYRPSSLTKKQQQDALAAVYGVNMAETRMTPEEAARMKQLLAQYESDKKPVTTTDLNNPPKEPYRFQKFPMIVYNHAKSEPAHDDEQPSRSGFGLITVHVPARVVTRTVLSEKDLQGALAEGFSEQAPEYREEREEPLSHRYAAEANGVNAKIEESRRRGPRIGRTVPA